VQAAWLSVLEGGQDLLFARWRARNGGAKLVSSLKAQVYVPHQYLAGKSEAALLARVAFNGVSLDSPIPGQEDAVFGDLFPAKGLSQEQLVAEKRRYEHARSLCVGNQLAMLEGLLAGKSLSDVADERGVSRAKVSLEYVALKGKMKALREPKKPRIKRKRRMELTRGLLMKAFAGSASMNENQLVLALRKLGFRVRACDARVRFEETGLLTWTEGDPEKRIKGVYRLVTPNSIRAKKVVKVYDVPCKRCGVVVQRKYERKEALCVDCEKAWKREWYLKQKEGK
jgi:hypothetical protein